MKITVTLGIYANTHNEINYKSKMFEFHTWFDTEKHN